MNPTISERPTYSSLLALNARSGGRFETLDELYLRLQVAGYHPQKSHDNETLKSLCPVHERSGEHGRSLGVRVKNLDDPASGLKFVCYGGCDQDVVFDTLTAAALPPSTAKLSRYADANGGLGFLSAFELRNDADYLAWCEQQSGDDRIDETLHVYRDQQGTPTGVVKSVFRVNGKRTMDMFYRADRWDDVRDQPYAMTRHRLSKPLPLYGIHTITPLAPGSLVFAVEGEKDVDTLIAKGMPAVSTRWFGGRLSDLVPPLAGMRVAVIPDNDFDNPRAGLNYAHHFAHIVNKLPNVSVVMLPPLESPLPNGTTKRGYDVTDFITDGGTVKDLFDLAQQASALPAPDDRATTSEEFVDEHQRQQYDEALQKRAAQKLMELHATDIAIEANMERRRVESGLSADNLGIDLTDPDVRSPKPPTILTADDDDEISLLYPGEINTIFGPAGSMKTMLALYAIAQQLRAGRSAAMLSLELAPWVVMERLETMMDVPLSVIQSSLFIENRALARGSDILQAATRKTGRQPAIMVVDSVNKVLGAYDSTGNQATEIVQYHTNLARPFQEAGVTFVNIDHPNRTDETRPIGNQEKMSAVQGASYGVAVPRGQRPKPGQAGYSEITLRKDQPSKTGLELDAPGAWLYIDDNGKVFLQVSGRPLCHREETADARSKYQPIIDVLDDGAVFLTASSMARRLTEIHGTAIAERTWRSYIKELIADGTIYADDKGKNIQKKP